MSIYGNNALWRTSYHREAMVGCCLKEVEDLSHLNQMAYGLDGSCHDIAGVNPVVPFDERLQKGDLLPARNTNTTHGVSYSACHTIYHAHGALSRVCVVSPCSGAGVESRVICPYMVIMVRALQWSTT